jgi:heme ABC exporter ATP-binding subunit CcmA
VPVLEVSGLSHSFGEHAVLTDVSFEVAEGEAVAVVGPNGAGKTTLLRAVTGSQPALEGSVDLLGRPLDERAVRVRRDMAVVMDDIDFFPDLTVVEHLDLLARAHGVDRAEELVDEVVREVGLRHVSAALPGALSSGQRRRLSLASALVRPRRLLVLDEPEQRLDVEGVEWLGARLLREKADGCAVLLVSHDPALVERVADRRIELTGPA